jgi:4-oxalocrotonate tautomerase
MPIVEITMIEGRSDEAKERLHAKVADAIHEAIDAPKESIRIIIREVPPLHFSAGGVAKTRPPAKS